MTHEKALEELQEREQDGLCLDVVCGWLESLEHSHPHAYQAIRQAQDAVLTGRAGQLERALDDLAKALGSNQ